ncbi:UNVERIFIED_CONTAM: hypothetical protein K2H54_030045 [Gekko kuhli]
MNDSNRVSFVVLLSAVLRAQFLLYQTEPFQFVDIGQAAEILCMSTETFPPGIYLSWYKRRGNELPVSVEECSDNYSNRNGFSSTAKFVCRAEQHRLILNISHVGREDSGLYLCATRYTLFSFSNGSFLVVGDSYTPSTRVTLLLPPPHLAPAGQVACVVHGVSNLVQVSWEVPGELHPEGRTLRVKNSSGLLTFVSVLQVPEASQWGGKNITCEVRFNSSGPRVKEVAAFPAYSDENCLSYVVPTVVVGLLALLILLLGLLWIRFCPSRLGFQLKVDEAPSSEVLEEGICYAQLDFPPGSQDRKKKKQQGPPGKN